MKERKTTEQQVADTILEKRKRITIGGETYEIAPPTLATVILVSELVSTLPPAPDTKNKKLDILQEVLQNARNSKVLGKIIAVLVLGAKRAEENHKVPVRINSIKPRRFWRRKRTMQYISEVDYLADLILNELSPAQANDVVASALMQLQIPDFFALTTSLTTANQIKPTREVEEDQTASGD